MDKTIDNLISSKNKVAGVKQTKNAIISGQASMVYVAYDADEELTGQITALCEENGTEFVSDFSRKELAKACRIEVPCAAAAVLK